LTPPRCGRRVRGTSRIGPSGRPGGEDLDGFRKEHDGKEDGRMSHVREIERSPPD
jgi:hypothetical protein